LTIVALPWDVQREFLTGAEVVRRRERDPDHRGGGRHEE
jgi:hypothetical protein